MIRGAIHLVAASAVLIGCAREPVKTASTPPEPVVREYEGDGAEVRVTLDRSEATPADRLTLRIERTSAPGWAPGPPIEESRVGDRLGSFTIADIQRSRPSLDVDGRRTESVEYTLLPFLPGEEQIPAMRWSFVALPAPGEAPDAAHEPVVVETEPIPVTVLTLLDADDASLASQKGVVAPPPMVLWPWVVGGGAGLALLGAAAALIAVRAARWNALPKAAPPAHVEALEAMASLESRDLPRQGLFEPYFTELSWILRRYIERRFEVHAPMLTTDEFLHQTRRSSAIRAEFVRELEQFLRLADLVKFARHAPPVNEAGRAHDTARAFVEATVPVEAPGAEARP